ncbi:unnamed protein product, partial [Rotaria sp. Silwood1]
MFCVGSIYDGGNFRLSMKAAMQQSNSRIWSSSLGTSEIQQITIGGDVTSEHQ